MRIDSEAAFHFFLFFFRKLLLSSMLLCNACRDNQKKDVKKILHEEDSDCVLINAAGER